MPDEAKPTTADRVLTKSELLAATPFHLATVVWYQVNGFGMNQEVVKRRATFYKERVEWKDHPWADGRRHGGVSFFNEWTLETEHESGWRADGRTNDGWGALSLDGSCHETRLEALNVLLKRVHAATDACRRELREWDRKLAAVTEEVRRG